MRLNTAILAACGTGLCIAEEPLKLSTATITTSTPVIRAHATVTATTKRLVQRPIRGGMPVKRGQLGNAVDAMIIPPFHVPTARELEDAIILSKGMLFSLSQPTETSTSSQPYQSYQSSRSEEHEGGLVWLTKDYNLQRPTATATTTSNSGRESTSTSAQSRSRSQSQRTPYPLRPWRPLRGPPQGPPPYRVGSALRDLAPDMGFDPIILTLSRITIPVQVATATPLTRGVAAYNEDPDEDNSDLQTIEKRNRRKKRGENVNLDIVPIQKGQAQVRKGQNGDSDSSDSNSNSDSGSGSGEGQGRKEYGFSTTFRVTITANVKPTATAEATATSTMEATEMVTATTMAKITPSLVPGAKAETKTEMEQKPETEAKVETKEETTDFDERETKKEEPKPQQDGIPDRFRKVGWTPPHRPRPLFGPDGPLRLLPPTPRPPPGDNWEIYKRPPPLDFDLDLGPVRVDFDSDSDSDSDKEETPDNKNLGEDNNDENDNGGDDDDESGVNNGNEDGGDYDYDDDDNVYPPPVHPVEDSLRAVGRILPWCWPLRRGMSGAYWDHLCDIPWEKLPADLREKYGND